MMIAEESTAFPGVSAPTDSGGLGFGFKWNMGWMHDSLEYIQKESVYRKYHHGEITFSMLYAYDEKFLLPISHDEVVHGKGSLFSKMPGDHWQKLANMRAFLSFMWAHPGKKLLFMGQEFAQVSEWSESRNLDWWLLDHDPHQGMQQLVSELNQVYQANPALWELDHEPEGFRWIDGSNSEQNVLSFVRTAANGDRVIVVVNFADYPYHNYRIGVPGAGGYSEILNSDAAKFGGSNVVNQSKLASAKIAAHGFEDSIELSIPPLGSTWLKLS
jgi:1,4-alpha-glucan branching enzyme